MREYHIKLEAAGHKLFREEDGSVDIFRLDFQTHNGPGCELCDQSWCHHCCDEIKPCPKTKPPKKLEISEVLWEYEDELPKMEESDFNAIFEASRVDIVRMYPYVKDAAGKRIWISKI